MKLISAELYNFCQYRYIMVSFAPGLTAIVGKNGSGKSNLIKAIYATVAGDFGRNEGVKTDNISQFAGPTDVAKVNVVLEHGPAVIDITRSLRPIATRLKIETTDTAPKIITKTQEATDALTSILGVSSRMLADYVFVDQWSIFDFLSMMPAERAKAFQRLFRTERAEMLWKIIGEHHDKIIIPTPGIDKDTVTKRLNENRNKYAILSQGLTRLSTSLSAQTPKVYAEIIDAWKTHELLSRERDGLTERFRQLKKEISSIDAQIDELNKTDLPLIGIMTTQREAYEAAQQELGVWNTFDVVDSNRRRLLARITQLDTLVSVEPKAPEVLVGTPDDPHWATWWREYDELKEDVCAANHFVAMLKSDAPCCPTCGTPANEFVKHQTALVEELTTKQNRQREMSLLATTSTTYRTQLAAYQSTMDNTNREREQLKDQLAQFSSVTKPDKSREELKGIIKSYDETILAHNTLQSKLHALFIQQHRKKSVMEQTETDAVEKDGLIAGLSVNKADAHLAQARLDAYNKLAQEKMEAEIAVRALIQLIKDDETALIKLEGVERDAGIMRKWAAYCLDMRHIVHRDNLPRLVAHNYLELMQDEINSLLIRFDSPFKVTADESLSFLAVFKDGRHIPAARLSGGEKVLLAIAFRVAVNDIFAKDLGLLVLDEPTAGLDEGNIACLRIAIARLKELSSARGLQVIMITHEHELHNLFDHVIEIGKE